MPPPKAALESPTGVRTIDRLVYLGCGGLDTTCDDHKHLDRQTLSRYGVLWQVTTIRSGAIDASLKVSTDVVALCSMALSWKRGIDTKGG